MVEWKEIKVVVTAAQVENRDNLRDLIMGFSGQSKKLRKFLGRGGGGPARKWCTVVNCYGGTRLEIDFTADEDDEFRLDAFGEGS